METLIKVNDQERMMAYISYKDAKTVEAYLGRYPKIRPFLQAAWPDLVRCFGEHPDIVLEVLTYPEEGA